MQHLAQVENQHLSRKAAAVNSEDLNREVRRTTVKSPGTRKADYLVMDRHNPAGLQRESLAKW